MVNIIWPTAMVGKAENVSSESASACHLGGPNSVSPGQTLLVYSTYNWIESFNQILCVKVGLKQ